MVQVVLLCYILRLALMLVEVVTSCRELEEVMATTQQELEELLEGRAAVKDKAKNITAEDDQKMADIYQNFFGALFPFLDTAKPLDFNRCVTYRNHRSHFSGTSILEKEVGSSGASVLTTAGCFGVGVKFGPALGEAAAAHTAGDDLQVGMDVFQSGFESDDDVGEKIERAW